MKILIYLLAMGAFLAACKDEKPHFLPKEDPSIETGGTGASLSADPAVLRDGKMQTTWEGTTGDNGKSAVVLENTSEMAAYTLVSSGIAQYSGDKVVVPCDPVSWILSGSEDGKVWTEIETKNDVKFFARYQKHLYKLAAPVHYKKYKFEFTPAGGESVVLAEIEFHPEDPDAGWEHFEGPVINFLDQADDRGSRLYNLLVQDKKAYLAWHALEVCKTLYFNDNDKRMDTRSIDYFLEPMPGEVSYKSGSAPKVQIHYSTDWIQKSAEESVLKLSEETRGVLYHEMTHAFQLEPQGIEPYKQGNLSWSEIEGMADAVRTKAGLLDYAKRDTHGSLISGYQTTGMFLYWLSEAKDPDAIRKINASCHQADPWSWKAALKYVLGEDADEKTLWEEYKADEKNYQKP